MGITQNKSVVPLSGVHYPFGPIPSLEEELYDVHEEERLRVSLSRTLSLFQTLKVRFSPFSGKCLLKF